MLAWQIASRFRRAKQKNRYISFVSMSSTLGIGLGCFVLIVLLSIMNGFERELKERLLALIPHGELYSVDNQGIQNWQEHVLLLEQNPNFTNVEPYTKITGMLQVKGKLKAIELTGLDIESSKDSPWTKQVSEDDWQQFIVAENRLLLGKGIAQKLKVAVGQKVQVLVPTVTEDLSFKAPKTTTFEVAGVISVGGELDNYIAISHLNYTSDAAAIVSGAKGLRFTLADPMSAYSVMRETGYAFPQAVYMSDWTRTQGHLYQDIQLVRVVVYIALTLVIAVACFNIVSTLVMAVREKQSAIAILRTMGATDKLIRSVFIFQGVINGLIGIAGGTILAVVVAPNLSRIVEFVESTFGITVLSGDIYFIDFLPSQLEAIDVIITVVTAVLLCVVATVYPSNQAVKTNPATALNG